MRSSPYVMHSFRSVMHSFRSVMLNLFQHLTASLDYPMSADRS